MTVSWFSVGRNEDYPVGLHEIQVDDKKVILAILDMEVFAFDPYCPHMAGPLKMSETQGTVIACPLHGWRFDLRDNGREIHGFRAIKMYDVKIEHGSIFVGIEKVAGLGEFGHLTH